MPNNARVRHFQEIAVGDTAEFSLTLTAEMVAAFAAVSGDTNPLHTDEVYAAQTPFGRRLAHGMLGAALFSRLVGMQLPGLYSVYLSQTLFFRQPIFLEQKILVSGVVVACVAAAATVKLAMKITDAASQQILIEGEALVKLLK